MTIGEAAKRAGISVRTLRHYDAIGLLKPSSETRSGYRLYDEEALLELEQILYFKELGFALEDIADMMRAPDYDARAAMARQRDMLLAQRRRLDRMIERLEEAISGGGRARPEVFDMSEIETMKARYAQEAKDRWGQTDAWKESEQRTSGYGKAEWGCVQQEMDALMRAFADVRDLDVHDARVQALAAQWQEMISRNFYTCTKEILAGLGQMYMADERFKANIDRHGEGTAVCMAKAIEAYCRE